MDEKYSLGTFNNLGSNLFVKSMHVLRIQKHQPSKRESQCSILTPLKKGKKENQAI